MEKPGAVFAEGLDHDDEVYVAYEMNEYIADLEKQLKTVEANAESYRQWWVKAEEKIADIESLLTSAIEAVRR